MVAATSCLVNGQNVILTGNIDRTGRHFLLGLLRSLGGLSRLLSLHLLDFSDISGISNFSGFSRVSLNWLLLLLFYLRL